MTEPSAAPRRTSAAPNPPHPAAPPPHLTRAFTNPAAPRRTHAALRVLARRENPPPKGGDSAAVPAAPDRKAETPWS
jgi:hypothetical protein